MQLYRATALIAVVLMVLLAVGYAGAERAEPENVNTPDQGQYVSQNDSVDTLFSSPIRGA
jgi:hypothetical protein